FLICGTGPHAEGSTISAHTKSMSATVPRDSIRQILLTFHSARCLKRGTSLLRCGSMSSPAAAVGFTVGRKELFACGPILHCSTMARLFWPGPLIPIEVEKSRRFSDC